MLQKTQVAILLSLFVATAATAVEEVKTENPPAASSLSVELKIGSGIENREVTGEAENFPSGTDQIAAWTKISGATTPTEIHHVWLLDGEEVDNVNLKVSSSPFRTYSRKTVAGQPGKWTVQVKDESGGVLASKDVTVEKETAGSKTEQ